MREKTHSHRHRNGMQTTCQQNRKYTYTHSSERRRASEREIQIKSETGAYTWMRTSIRLDTFSLIKYYMCMNGFRNN